MKNSTRSTPPFQTIEFSELADWIEDVSNNFVPDAEQCRVRLHKVFVEKHPVDDCVAGSIEVDLEYEGAFLTLCASWRAKPQPLISDGWYLQPLFESKRNRLISSLPITSEGWTLDPLHGELAALVHGLWSYVDLDELILPLLPNREAQQRKFHKPRRKMGRKNRWSRG